MAAGAVSVRNRARSFDMSERKGPVDGLGLELGGPAAARVGDQAGPVPAQGLVVLLCPPCEHRLAKRAVPVPR